MSALDHGVSWLFGRKATAKKVSSKSMRHRIKLAKHKAKRGRHFKRYWGCTKEAKYKARQVAISANMHWSFMYWRCKEYEEYLKEHGMEINNGVIEVVDDEEQDDAFWASLPRFVDTDFDSVPGLLPKRTKCSCFGCTRFERTVHHHQGGYAKAPVSAVVSSCTKTCVPAVGMDLGDGNKSLISKLPVFSGKQDDFIMWLLKFTAIATMGAFAVSIAQNSDGSFGEKSCPKDQKEVDDIIDDIANNPLTDTSSTQTCVKRAEDKEKLEAWKRNSKAFASITLTMPNKLYRIIAGSGGLAHEAMRLLYRKYKPNDHMSHVEAERKYSASRLNDNGNPQYLSQRFAEIAHQHPNAAADEPKKIAIVLSAAPAMYQSILAAQQLALGDACESEDLIQAMEVVYRQSGGGNNSHGSRNNNNSSNNNNQIAMAAPGNRAVKCWNCGKTGHRSKECRAPNTSNKFKPTNSNNNNSNGNTRSQRNVVCDECGMRGHIRTLLLMSQRK